MRTILPLLALLVLPAAALAQPTFAYSANAGWINVAPLAATYVHVGESFLSGYAYGANIGWVSFGSGAPTNGYSYSNTAAGDFGVNHDGAGNLSGFAYSANTGWVNFGWAGLGDPNRPRFDLDDGEFHGFAYSANTGWVNLGAGYLTIPSIEHPDTDQDGIDDTWEKQWFGNLTTAGLGTDRDGDGQSDAAEYAADTDPLNAADYLKITFHDYTNGHTTVELRFTTQPSRRYRIQHSTDLVTWTESPLGTFAPAAGTETTKIFSFTGSARHFFRAIAVLPLTP